MISIKANSILSCGRQKSLQNTENEFFHVFFIFKYHKTVDIQRSRYHCRFFLRYMTLVSFLMQNLSYNQPFSSYFGNVLYLVLLLLFFFFIIKAWYTEAINFNNIEIHYFVLITARYGCAGLFKSSFKYKSILFNWNEE